MLPRTRTLLITVAATLLVALTGCDVAMLYGTHYDEWDRTTDPDLLAVIEPSGGTYEPGETVFIRWEGTDQPYRLAIDLYLSGELFETIATSVENRGTYEWTIPADFQAGTETANEYQVVVSGYHPEPSTGELFLIAYSEHFTIIREGTGGLSDVTVSQRLVDITLIDNGMEIDGDTVDVFLNGAIVAADHVLAGGAGTTFGLTLQSGENVLEVYAVNEGSVSPNTALLEISNVTAGLASQEWRLRTGEWGSLTITAP